MTSASKVLATGVILVFILSSCATGPTEVIQPVPVPSALSASPSPEETTKPPSSPDQQRSATGTFTSIDGQTTGRVEAEVKIMSDGSGLTASDATVRLFDLVTPYEHLSTGGALAPRGDDPCFDIGIRAGGGIIVPDENGSATTIMPTEVEGHELYEIVLHLDWTQIDPETESCLQPVVARAPLTWND